MECPECEQIMHMDSQGVTSCISCGYSYNQATQSEYRPKEFSYNNADIVNEHKAAMDDFIATYNDAGEKLQSTGATLKERGNRYGEFKAHAKISQRLKDTFTDGIVASGKDLEDIPEFMWEAVEMICHKLARVANGDIYYKDNFVDICGYSQLVVDELNREDLK